MDVDEIRGRYEARIPLLTQLGRSLADGLTQSLEGVAHVDRVTFRVKAAERFMEKAQRYEHPMIDIEDQVAGRVLVFFASDVQVISSAARNRWNVIEAVHKEPERDAEFGYESWHEVFVVPDHLKSVEWANHPDMPATFELQIRTLFMHAYAEPQHDLSYRNPAELSREDRKRLAWIAAAAWGADHVYLEVMSGASSRNGG